MAAAVGQGGSSALFLTRPWLYVSSILSLNIFSRNDKLTRRLRARH